jgi:hypothetical protein
MITEIRTHSYPRLGWTGSPRSSVFGLGSIAICAFESLARRRCHDESGREPRRGLQGISSMQPKLAEPEAPMGRKKESHLFFSPDGRKLLTLGDFAQLWDAATHKPIGDPIPNRAKLINPAPGERSGGPVCKSGSVKSHVNMTIDGCTPLVLGCFALFLPVKNRPHEI